MMFDVLSRMIRTGILTEPPRTPLEEIPARRYASEGSTEGFGPSPLHSPCRCGFVQWMRAGNPCAQQSLLQPRRNGDQIRC